MLPKNFIFGLISLCLIADCSSDNERCVASIGGACPPAWSQWKDKCYKAIKSLTWLEATEECIKMESVLVVPQSEEETSFLAKLHSQFWINCTDLQHEGLWVCLEGTDTNSVKYRNWAPGEPNNYAGKEDCAMVGWSSPCQWNDVRCDYQLPAICKQPVPQLLHF